MTTNQTIDGVPRELLERILSYTWFPSGGVRVFDLRLIDREQLRALLDAEPAPCAKSQDEGKRERFQKWVMATKHPVFGFLDGRSLARGDDRTGYADEYVQGLWVAYLEFGAEQPAPVAVPRLEMAHVVRAHMEIPGCPVLTSNQCHALAMKLNESLNHSL